MLRKNLIKYRLIEYHIKAFKAGRYEEARRLLKLLSQHRLSVGCGDDAGYNTSNLRRRRGACSRFVWWRTIGN